MAKISEYSEIESIGSDAMFIAETEDGSYRVPQAKLVELIEAHATGASDYAELSNKPQINSVELSGNKSLSDLGIQADLVSESANGDVAENRLYRDIVGARSWLPGSAVFANGTLTITYSTTNNWGGGGFFLNLFHGMPTEIRVKVDERTEYRNMWFLGISTASPPVNLNFADAQSWGGRMVDDGEYITFTIPASVEEQYGSYVSIINQNRNVTGGIVLSDLRVYPNKALDAEYVGEALGTGGVEELTDLSDVDISSVSNGQVLKYDSSTGKWKNDNESGGGGTVDTQMSDSSTNAVQNKVIKGYVDGKYVDAYTKSQTDTLLSAKQNTLTAGTGINIQNNVISATGGGSGNGNNVYTAYYIDQTGQGSTSTMKIAINEADDSSFVLNNGDLIILAIDSSDTLPATKADRIGLYANNETTRVVYSTDQPWNNVSEQFVAGHPYIFSYDGTITLLSSNVSTVAQVNALIDAKINALGNAEQEEF